MVGKKEFHAPSRKTGTASAREKAGIHKKRERNHAGRMLAQEGTLSKKRGTFGFRTPPTGLEPQSNTHGMGKKKHFKVGKVG